MRFYPSTALGALLLAAAPLSAQQPSQPAGSTNQVLRLPGQTVEIIGLHKWDLTMLQDSLTARGTPITSGACAATLRYKLGFADAAVIGTGPGKDGGPSYMLLTLTEPGDSARVKYRPLPIDTSAGRAEWKEAWELARGRETRRAFGVGLAMYLTYRDSAVSAWPEKTQADSVSIRALWAFLQKHNTPADQEAALKALESAPTLADRSAAIAILHNFPSDDRTWTAFANAMLEDEGPVKSLGSSGLRTLYVAKYRPSSWNVIAPQIHAVFNGTSQFMILDLMQFVAAIKPDSSLAPAFLKNGGALLLGYAGVEHPALRARAIMTLKALSGKDFGEDVAQWRAWVAAL